MTEQPKYPVKTLENALQVLNIMYESNDYRGMGITELSNITGLNKSAVHRIMGTLAVSGFVEKDMESNRYRLGWGLYSIGQKVPKQNNLYTISAGHIAELSKAAFGTINLGVLRGTDVIIISKTEANKQGMNTIIGIQVGEAECAYATAIGKLILSDKDDDEIRSMYADAASIKRLTDNTVGNVNELINALQQIRDKGYAVDNEELVAGLSCIAKPIRDYTGRIIAGISISMSSNLWNDANRKKALDELGLCCGNISGSLGYIKDSGKH